MNRLIVAASETDPDLLYATGFFAPDAFIYIETKGRKIIALSDLEIDRGRREARVDEILSQSEIAKSLPAGERSSTAEVAAALLKKLRIRRVAVPGNFPLGLAVQLQKHGIRLDPQQGLFFPERETKTAEEIKLLRRALRITEAGMARGHEILRAAETGKTLRWTGRVLTSEILRAEIDSAILRAGGLPANTIVAGGEQACDPHERGSGPLRPNQLIILDIFPRDTRSGYYGDMTRTVVRGRATDAQRKLWETVLDGQKLALRSMKSGADGAKIHDFVKSLFTDRGYPTERRNGRHVGFFHGTGHGLGLEIHEEPRFSRTKFKPGQVLTVEPGLYYPGIGGVRHEDVATITADGIRLLSRFPKVLEL